MMNFRQHNHQKELIPTSVNMNDRDFNVRMLAYRPIKILTDTYIGNHTDNRIFHLF